MATHEEVVNGVLCHWNESTGQWIPFTLEALTIAYNAVNNTLLIARDERDRNVEKLREIRRVLDR